MDQADCRFAAWRDERDGLCPAHVRLDLRRASARKGLPMRLHAPRRMLRRGGRVAEGARLESVYAGNRIAGSNPAPSAISLFGTIQNNPVNGQKSPNTRGL